MALNAAERGATLTSRLLAFSRKQPLEPKVLDVGQIVQGLDELLRRVLPEDIDIEIIRSGGLWKIETDAAQLETAFLNLAVNARDAMPDGGRLTIEAANAMLDDEYVSTETDLSAGQYVVIIVTDTGFGMSDDILSQVFEPFFTTKPSGQGSGLGLSMVFGFVKQSGGHIKVYSEQGEGTSIKMYFPRSWEKTERSASPVRRKLSGGSETILVVEDDANVREHVVSQLHTLGYRVVAASSGAEALDILHQTPGIDLLFTDVVMPGGMGGKELADKTSASHPEVKVLFTSGYTENAVVHHGRLDHGVKLLNKPYRRDQLAAKVREVLDEA
jgi:CheY-like chemotaxis protein